MKELQILSPDGNSRAVPLEGQRLSLGRAAMAELSYPDDSGLSRQHLVFEREGDEWAIQDLGSKNGTLLNGGRLAVRTTLKPGDRITAGHLILIYDGASQRTSRPVVVFDAQAEEDAQTHSSTVVTDLGDVIRH